MGRREIETTTRLAEIRARAEAATPGPWGRDSEAALDLRWAAWYVLAGDGVCVARVYHAALPNAANATFVAGCRDDVPWLLDLVESQARMLADLREESDAARAALRYRRALEVIAAGRVSAGGVAYPMLGADAADVALLALEGRADDPH